MYKRATLRGIGGYICARLESPNCPTFNTTVLASELHFTWRRLARSSRVPPPGFFSSESTTIEFFSTGRGSPRSRKEGGKARRSDLSHARPITAKLDARRATGETLDKIASLQDHVKAFA